MEGKWTDRNELDKINELFDEKNKTYKTRTKKKMDKNTNRKQKR